MAPRAPAVVLVAAVLAQLISCAGVEVRGINKPLGCGALVPRRRAPAERAACSASPLAAPDARQAVATLRHAHWLRSAPVGEQDLSEALRPRPAGATGPAAAAATAGRRTSGSGIGGARHAASADGEAAAGSALQCAGLGAPRRPGTGRSCPRGPPAGGGGCAGRAGACRLAGPGSEATRWQPRPGQRAEAAGGGVEQLLVRQATACEHRGCGWLRGAAFALALLVMGAGAALLLVAGRGRRAAWRGARDDGDDEESAGLLSFGEEVVGRCL
jgi:hypothetical protein